VERRSGRAGAVFDAAQDSLGLGQCVGIGEADGVGDTSGNSRDRLLVGPPRSLVESAVH